MEEEKKVTIEENNKDNIEISKEYHTKYKKFNRSN